ncbi:SdrD B-like domain-containing protein [Solihabitans fulvus]|uniref:SdrD B-like domain-containing protein n=1 Tax=Solihabitans fulvus TaxID=1892852 RepID=UPI00166205C5|nr:SdrD B-like domain-containing protein [Solihabitans fulvus]
MAFADPLPGGAIGGSVFFDRNGDGIRQADEPVRPNVEIHFRSVADGKTGNFTTDNNGNYTVTHVADGDYEISYADDAFASTTQGTQKVTVKNGSIVSGVNFGVRGGSICGTAWKDLNNDNRRQADEPVIPNHTVGIVGQGTKYVNTGADGRYCLQDLPVGTYTLQTNDRSLLDGTGYANALWKPGQLPDAHGASKFDLTDGMSAPVKIEKGANGSITQIDNFDTGFVPANMDLVAARIGFDGVPGGRDTFQVGDTFTVYGNVQNAGAVAEQLGATLTLPEGLKVLDREGGMPSEVRGQQVVGQFHERRFRNDWEFIGAKVQVVKAFSAAEIKLEVPRGVFKDINPDNNVLTRKISAVDAPATSSTPAAPSTDTAAPAAAAVQDAAVTPVAETKALANTGVAPLGVLGLGSVLLVGGGAAVWAARRKRV